MWDVDHKGAEFIGNKQNRSLNFIILMRILLYYIIKILTWAYYVYAQISLLLSLWPWNKLTDSSP